MIVFDLRCAHGHVFEAWFGSSNDYEDQRARGQVACPLCGDGDIGKAVMAPRLGSGAADEATVPIAAPSQAPAEVKAMLAKMAQIQAKLLERSDWVGRRFADQARSMHFGEIESRPIHGQATPDQAAAMIDEGIAVAPLPFPVTPPETRN